MISAVEVLNRIKWSPEEDVKDYSVVYYDRITDHNNELKFINIKEINNLFIVVERDREEINIPMHSVREIKNKDIIIWKR